MKKLFPILTILLALFAGPLIGQDAEQPTDAPNTEESAKTADEENPADSESTDGTKPKKAVKSPPLRKHRQKSTPATLLG